VTAGAIAAAGWFTVTRAVAWIDVPSAPVAVTVYSVDRCGAMLREPLIPTVPNPVIVTLSALVVAQLKVDD
jgi:hypothetical protein